MLPASTPPHVGKEFAGRIITGLMLQLRSVPVGLRVDRWSTSTYPSLRDLQRTSIERQLGENAQALSTEVKKRRCATFT